MEPKLGPWEKAAALGVKLPVVLAVTPWMPDLRKIFSGEEDPPPPHYRLEIYNQALRYRGILLRAAQARKRCSRRRYGHWTRIIRRARDKMLRLGHDILAPSEWPERSIEDCWKKYYKPVHPINPIKPLER